MKVLRDARSDVKWSLKLQCPDCTSLLEADQDDIQSLEVYGPREMYHAFCVVCPVCQYRIHDVDWHMTVAQSKHIRARLGF